MRERRIIIYIAAKPGQGQSAVVVDVLEGTKQCGACGGAARITKQVLVGHCNVGWSCGRHDMVHTATGHGVVSSGLVLGVPRGASLTTKHIVKQTNQAKTSQGDTVLQPVLLPRLVCRPYDVLPVRYDYLLSPSEFGSSSYRESVNGLLVSLTTCSRIQTCLFGG